MVGQSAAWKAVQLVDEKVALRERKMADETVENLVV